MLGVAANDPWREPLVGHASKPQMLGIIQVQQMAVFVVVVIATQIKAVCVHEILRVLADG